MYITHTHTHTHKTFYGPLGFCPGLPGWAGTRKVKPVWIYCSKWSCFCIINNDCVSDILGDGAVHPWQLISAPLWLKGYGGNELQRTARQLAMQGRYLREMFPTKYHTLVKNLNFQFKKINRRQHCSWWGGYRRFSRIDKPRLRYWCALACSCQFYVKTDV